MPEGDSQRASRGGGSSEEALPPPNAYGPPPGVFKNILKSLGIWKETQPTARTEPTPTTTPTTETSSQPPNRPLPPTPTTTTTPTTETSSQPPNRPLPPTPSGPPPNRPPPPTPTAPPQPTFEEALAEAVTKKDLDALHKLATDETSRGKVVDAMLAANLATEFLTMIQAAGSVGTWATNFSDARYETLMAKTAAITDANAFNNVWTLYKDPVARSLNAATLSWEKLYTSRIVPAGDTGVTWPGGTSADGTTTWEWRTLYMPVGPSEATMKRLMVGIRPLPRGHVNLGNIAFVNQSQQQYKQTAPTPGAWTNHGAAVALTTSYYLDPCKTSVIFCDASGGAQNDFASATAPGAESTAVGQVQGGPALEWFLNHARHEVGHAVGAKVFAGMAEKGDDWAKTYGGWAASSEADFKAQMWTSGDKKKLTVNGTETEVEANAVRDWITGLISGGAEPGGNAVTAIAGTLRQKLAAVVAAYGDQPAVKYFNAVFTRSGLGGFKDGGYEYRGFTPSADPVIWCSRWNAGFVKYSKAAFDALNASHGWYCLASPAEMFAEIYTHKYSGGALPAAVNGKDPAKFFADIEKSSDSQFTAPGTAARGSLPMNPPAPSAPTTSLPTG